MPAQHLRPRRRGRRFVPAAAAFLPALPEVVDGAEEGIRSACVSSDNAARTSKKKRKKTAQEM